MPSQSHSGIRLSSNAIMLHQSFFLSCQPPFFLFRIPSISLRLEFENIFLEIVFKKSHYSVRATDNASHQNPKPQGLVNEKTVAQTFSQPKLPTQIKNKLQPIVCIHLPLKRKGSLGRILGGESHTCKRSKMRRNAVSTDTEGQHSAKINH